MKKPYETLVVFDGNLTEDVLNKEQQKVEEIIKQYAEFEKTDVWGKQSMAYTVRKRRVGFYCLFLYQSESQEVMLKIDTEFKLNDAVLRHLSVVRTSGNVLPHDADMGSVLAARAKPEEGDNE